MSKKFIWSLLVVSLLTMFADPAFADVESGGFIQKTLLGLKQNGIAAVSALFVIAMAVGVWIALKGYKICQEADNPESKMRDATMGKGLRQIALGASMFLLPIYPVYIGGSLLMDDVSQAETMSGDYQIND